MGDITYDATRWGKPATMEHVQRGDTALVQGHGGESVVQLQQRLAQLGYLPESAVDGRFGPQTRDALKKFQAENGIKADGMFGKESHQRLFADNARTPNSGPARGSDAAREHNRDMTARKDFAKLVKDDPWKEDLSVDKRAARVAAGRERIAKLEGAMDSMPPEQQARAKETIAELKKLYDRLEGRYYLGGSGDDARNAKALEDKLARELPARS